VIAVLGSLFYGFSAISIFVPKQEDHPKSWPWKIHQFWFNFVGALAGWLALALLMLKFGNYDSFPRSLENLTFLDLVIFFLAFIGITGHLPYTIAGLLNSLSEVFIKALKKLYE